MSDEFHVGHQRSDPSDGETGEEEDAQNTTERADCGEQHGDPNNTGEDQTSGIHVHEN